jgi:hypothetical protein
MTPSSCATSSPTSIGVTVSSTTTSAAAGLRLTLVLILGDLQEPLGPSPAARASARAENHARCTPPMTRREPPTGSMSSL